MAKKKKSTGSKRKKVGAMSLSASSPLVMYGSIAAGYFFGDKLNDAVDKATGGKIDGKIVGGAEAGLGALLVFGKGKKSLPKTIAGGVLLGAGAKKMLKEFGVISGYGSVPVVGRRRINGYGSVPVVGGYTPSVMLAGALNGNGNGMNAGYPVPRPPHKQVVGSYDDGNGSGITDRN